MNVNIFFGDQRQAVNAPKTSPNYLYSKSWPVRGVPILQATNPKTSAYSSTDFDLRVLERCATSLIATDRWHRRLRRLPTDKQVACMQSFVLHAVNWTSSWCEQALYN
jgi:hypothetical protein